LFRVFKGEQLPRDPEVCKLLDVPTFDFDFTSTENRLVELGGLDPSRPYGLR
jgi:hypothetical protein